MEDKHRRAAAPRLFQPRGYNYHIWETALPCLQFISWAHTHTAHRGKANYNLAAAPSVYKETPPHLPKQYKPLRLYSCRENILNNKWEVLQQRSRDKTYRYAGGRAGDRPGAQQTQKAG